MSNIIHGQRDKEPGTLNRRMIRLELVRAVGDNPEESTVNCIASTDENYDWGGYNEMLMHGPDAVDVTAAVSVLFNHNRNSVIGKILSTNLDGHKMTAKLEIDGEVKGENGLGILGAIRKGYLRGVSVGYDYKREDCTFTEDGTGKRNIVVNKWQLREISITPTPADVAATVTRQFPDWLNQTVKVADVEVLDMDFVSWLAARGLTQADLTVEALAKLKSKFEAEIKEKAVASETQKDELTKEREARKTAEREAGHAKVRLEMNELSRSHGVEIKNEEFEGKSREACLQLILERKASTEAAKINPTGSAAVNIGTEAIEKVREAATDAILERAGVKIEASRLQGNPFVGRRDLDIGKRFAILAGVRGVEEWRDHDIGNYMLGRGKNRSANVTTGMFDTYVLANVMDKAVARGFSAFGLNATYPRWTRTRQVSDFKTVNGAALDVGNLVKTVEDAPFPELAKAEYGYSAALAMWGVTASLTLQVLVNDDLGEFMNQIFRAGQIANRTIEKEVYAQLEAATWTDNVTSGAGLGTGATPTPGNLDVSRKAFINKTGPAGEKLGNVPRFLIHQPSEGVPVGVALGRIVNYAGVSGSIASMTLEPIESTYLAGTATTYYLAGDPNLVDTAIILMLNGMMTPQVEEYDPGAVAARKWKIFMPFSANIINTSVGGTRYAPGLQQATV